MAFDRNTTATEVVANLHLAGRRFVITGASGGWARRRPGYWRPAART